MYNNRISQSFQRGISNISRYSIYKILLYMWGRRKMWKPCSWCSRFLFSVFYLDVSMPVTKSSKFLYFWVIFIIAQQSKFQGPKLPLFFVCFFAIPGHFLLNYAARFAPVGPGNYFVHSSLSAIFTTTLKPYKISLWASGPLRGFLFLGGAFPDIYSDRWVVWSRFFYWCKGPG